MAHIAEAEEPDRLLTRRQVAERLSLSVSGVKNLEKAEAVPTVRVGHAVRVRESDVRRIIAQGTGGA